MRLALISARVTEAVGYDEPRDAVAQDWALLLCEYNIAPVPVMNALTDLDGLLDRLAPDMIILSGGDDPGSSIIADAPPATPSMARRDATEVALLDSATRRGLPVLGVCRGFQVINARLGGHTVRSAAPETHVAATHPVTTSGPFQVGHGHDEVQVNSFHANVIAPDGLAPPLDACAIARDGTIEAAVHRDADIIGVQWHPERPGAPTEINDWIFREWTS